MTSKPTSTQIGAIAENLVANALMLGSAGRLSPFQPVADDDGIDLLVYDKETGKAAALQIKARTCTNPKKGGGRSNTVQSQVREATYKLGRKGFVLVVLLDKSVSRVEVAWLIPMSEVPHVAVLSGKRYHLQMSRQADSRDRFSEYRYHSMEEMVGRMLTRLDASGSFFEKGVAENLPIFAKLR